MFDIRQLFTPIQPTVRQLGSGEVLYAEALPADGLLEMVYCYWMLKTSAPLAESFTYRVVADGCIDVFFAVDRPSESFVMGFCKEYTEFQLDDHFYYAGIRFLPSMFSQLFRINAADLSNRSQPLEAIIPGLARYLVQSTDPLSDFATLKTLFDRYLLSYCAGVNFDEDPRFYHAWT